MTLGSCSIRFIFVHKNLGLTSFPRISNFFIGCTGKLALLPVNLFYPVSGDVASEKMFSRLNSNIPLQKRRLGEDIF